MIFISTPSPIYMSSILLGQVSLLMNLISTPSHFHNDPTTTHCWRTCSHSWPYQQTKRFWPCPMIQPTQSTTWVDWVSERSYKAQQGMTQGHLDLALPTTIPTLWSIASADSGTSVKTMQLGGSNMSSYISWLGLIPTPSSPWQPWQLFQIKNNLNPSKISCLYLEKQIQETERFHCQLLFTNRYYLFSKI